MGVQKRGSEQGFDVRDGFGGGEVFGDVAGGVAPDEAEMRSAFKCDGANEDVLQRGVSGGLPGFAEGEFFEGAASDVFDEERDKSGARGWRGGRHGHPR